MPYASIADLPAAVRSRYSTRCQQVFREAFNAEHERSGDDGAAMRAANVAAGRCQEQDHRPVNDAIRRAAGR